MLEALTPRNIRPFAGVSATNPLPSLRESAMRPANAHGAVIAIACSLVLVSACGTGSSKLTTPSPSRAPTVPSSMSPTALPSTTPTSAAATAVPSVATPHPARTPSPGASSAARTCLDPTMAVDALWDIVDSIKPVVQACIDGGDVRVTGWLASAWGIGGTNSGIVPAWLGEWSTDPVLWMKPRQADGCMSTDGCHWIFLHVRPDSGLKLGPPERWVALTGHLDDPAAATCRWSGIGEPISPDRGVATCRARFVVTALNDAAAP